MIKKLISIATKVRSMSELELTQRMEELEEKITKFEAMGISDFDLNLEAMIILHRLIEEGKLDISKKE